MELCDQETGPDGFGLWPLTVVAVPARSLTLSLSIVRGLSHSYHSLSSVFALDLVCLKPDFMVRILHDAMNEETDSLADKPAQRPVSRLAMMDRGPRYARRCLFYKGPYSLI